MPWTYILRCSDDSYYVGSTAREIQARVWEHNHSPNGAAYTRRRRPVELTWCCWFDRIDEAFAFEKRVQGWGRRKREALIRNEWTALPPLARRKSVQDRQR